MIEKSFQDKRPSGSFYMVTIYVERYKVYLDGEIPTKLLSEIFANLFPDELSSLFRMGGNTMYSMNQKRNKREFHCVEGRVYQPTPFDSLPWSSRNYIELHYDDACTEIIIYNVKR